MVGGLDGTAESIPRGYLTECGGTKQTFLLVYAYKLVLKNTYVLHIVHRFLLGYDDCICSHNNSFLAIQSIRNASSYMLS